MLNRKLIRDFVKNRIQFVSIFLMTFLGIALLVGFDFYRTGLEKSIGSYYKQTNLADLWISAEGLTADDINAVLSVPGVAGAEGRLSVSGKRQSEQEDKLYATFLESNEISKMYLEQGNPFPATASGIWLDSVYAEAQDVRLGDTLTIQTEAGVISGVVEGLIRHPEYVYYQENDSDMAPDYGTYGFVFTGMDNLKTAADNDTSFNEIVVDVEEQADIDVIQRELTQLFPKENPVHIYPRSSMNSYLCFDSEIVQAKILGTVFPIVFLIVAFLGIATTMTRLTAAERAQIGTLKALGFTKRAITRHYISFGFWICLVGSVTGGITGSILVPLVEFEYIRSQYVIPDVSASMSARSLYSIVLTTCISTFVAYMACRKELADAPAVALRPRRPKFTKKSFLEKAFFWNRLSFGSRWNIRDIMRNPMRTIMGMIGIAGCCMLLVCAFGLVDSCMGLDEWMYDELYTADGKISFKDTLANEDRQEYARELSGQLTDAESVDFRFDGLHNTGIVNVIGDGNLVHVQNYALEELSIPAHGVLMSRKTGELLDAKKGDLIEFRIVGDSKWHAVRVVDFYMDYNDKGIVISQEQFQAMNCEFVPNSLYTNYRLSDSFLQENGIAGYHTREGLKEALRASLEGISTDITLLIVFALLLGSVMLYNLGSLSFSEKVREMATLKVLGFHTQTIRNILRVQNLWVTITGILIGLPLGKQFLAVICASMSDTSDFPVILHVQSVLLAIGLTYAASELVNWIMSQQVKSIDMVEALKGTE